jgi:hypothetical protein
MTRASNVEGFAPHRKPVTRADMLAALADLNPVDGLLGVSIPLPYTRRADGTVDTIEIGPCNPDEWTVWTGRNYDGGDFGNITSTVGRCPGHMVILVARALYSHLSTVGPQGRKDTAEGHILYALGLTRPIPTEGGPYIGATTPEGRKAFLPEPPPGSLNPYAVED